MGRVLTSGPFHAIPCYSPHFRRLPGLQAGYPAPESVGAWKIPRSAGAGDHAFWLPGTATTAATERTTTQEFPSSLVEGIVGVVTKELPCNLLKGELVEQCIFLELLDSLEMCSTNLLEVVTMSFRVSGLDPFNSSHQYARGFGYIVPASQRVMNCSDPEPVNLLLYARLYS